MRTRAVALFFVLASLQLEWRDLRFLTSEAILRISIFLGTACHRISFDTIELGGTAFQYTVSCTLMDAFCGSIPLLWSVQQRAVANIRRLAVYAASLFALNVCRLEFGNVLYGRGVPWFYAHECVSAVVYFLMFRHIVRFRESSIPKPDRSSPA